MKDIELYISFLMFTLLTALFMFFGFKIEVVYVKWIVISLSSIIAIFLTISISYIYDLVKKFLRFQIQASKDLKAKELKEKEYRELYKGEPWGVSDVLITKDEIKILNKKLDDKIAFHKNHLSESMNYYEGRLKDLNIAIGDVTEVEDFEYEEETIDNKE